MGEDSSRWISSSTSWRTPRQTDSRISSRSSRGWRRKQDKRSDAVKVAICSSAAAINLPFNSEVVLISGTTTINTLNGGYGGRTLTLIFQGASGLGTSGNIATAFTAAANKGVKLILRPLIQSGASSVLMP